MYILDTRSRKIGAAVIALLLVATGATGMAFSLQADPAAWEWPGFSAQFDTHIDAERVLIHRRVAALNARLAPLDETRAVNLAALEDTTGLYDATVWGEWDAAFGSALRHGDLSALEASGYIVADATTPALCAAASEILSAAGCGQMPRLSVAQDPDMGDGSVEIYAGTATGEDSAYLALDDSLRLLTLSSAHAPLVTRTEPISGAQRGLARAWATAFCDAVCAMDNDGQVRTMVSDMAYTAALDEPYTFVWVYRQTYGGGAFDSEDLSSNDGYQVAVGLETGRVYAVSSRVDPSEFALQAQAGRDWKALFGLSYPYMGDAYIRDWLIPSIENRMYSLTEYFWEALSQEERLMGRHLADNAMMYLTVDCDWEPLLRDLEAVDSAEALRAVLYGSYQGVNQSPPGVPSRADILAGADAALATLGYGHLPYRSYLYAGGLGRSIGGYEHEIRAATDFGGARSYAAESVSFQMDEQGLIRRASEYNPRRQWAPAPATEAERLYATEAATHIAAQALGLAGVDADGASLSATAFESPDGRRMLRAAVPFADNRFDWQTSLVLSIDTADARVYDLFYADGPDSWNLDERPWYYY